MKMIQNFLFCALLLSLCLTVSADPLSTASVKPAIAIADTAAKDIMETAESRHGGGHNWKHGGGHHHGGGGYHGGGGGHHRGGGGHHHGGGGHGRNHWGK
ncbi:hypothetical protein HHI36_000974 [Cryptolaemus montrouzieri]|uniref:Uncharacterized protein n=1 Tax=Cryptolaemus montrouzieri TaxID=559131 RepID=A0ABD2P651_9CUCU